MLKRYFKNRIWVFKEDRFKGMPQKENMLLSLPIKEEILSANQ